MDMELIGSIYSYAHYPLANSSYDYQSEIYLFHLVSNSNIEDSYNVVQSEQASLLSTSLFPQQENLICTKLKCSHLTLQKILHKQIFTHDLENPQNI